LPRLSLASSTRFSFGCAAALLLAWRCAGAAADLPDADIRLELMPRICTLGAKDRQCQTRILAQWQAAQEQSLCLIILDRPEIKRCWENYSHGNYTLELSFDEDLTFQLRDPQLQQILASEVLKVIREAIRYRHKRREPWNVFD
jgi:hypothetical protein